MNKHKTTSTMLIHNMFQYILQLTLVTAILIPQLFQPLTLPIVNPHASPIPATRPMKYRDMSPAPYYYRDVSPMPYK